MFVLKGSQVVYCDVDDTLLMWHFPKDPEDTVITLEPWNDGEKVSFVVNVALIEELKKHSARGHKIVVWSQGGWDWAETAVKALGLEKYVHAVMEKPSWTYDDLPPQEFMPKSKWVGSKKWLE